MKRHLHIRDWSLPTDSPEERLKSSESFGEIFKIHSRVGGLLLVQAKNGHQGFGLQGWGRHDPVNQSLRIVREFAGNDGAISQVNEGRGNHSVGIRNSGDDVARTAAEFLNHYFSAFRGAVRFRVRDRVLRTSDATGEQSNGRDGQPQDTYIRAHKSLGCGYEAKAFSNSCVKMFTRSTGALILAFLLAGVACCAQSAPSAPPPDGKKIFLSQCAKCHGDYGQGVSAAVSYAGPSLQAEHLPGNVMAAMEIGPEHMPRFQYVLSSEEMRAVARYVTQTLAVIPLSGGNLSEGGELYRSYCAPCHRTDLHGGGLAFVGTNAPSIANKSAALVAGAIRWGPGPMPSFPPTVLNDQQVASIVDYVVAMQHPASPGGSPLGWYGPVAEGFAAWVMLLVLVLFSIWVEHGGQG